MKTFVWFINVPSPRVFVRESTKALPYRSVAYNLRAFPSGGRGTAVAVDEVSHVRLYIAFGFDDVLHLIRLVTSALDVLLAKLDGACTCSPTGEGFK